MYDLILTLSTCKSNATAADFLASLYLLKGNVLPILTSPDAAELKQLADRFPATQAVYLKAPVDSVYFGRAWGFVWAVHNGLAARYLATCDDDLVFRQESANILPRADQASAQIGFSLLGFASTHPIFPQPYYDTIDGFLVGFEWLDANFILSHWEDNLAYGVIDSTTEVPLCYFTEVEYCQRMRLLTGRPIIFDHGHNFNYNHVFRSDPAKNAQRARQTSSVSGITSGNQFFEKKFGLQNVDFQGRPGMAKVIQDNLMNQEHRRDFERHLLFDGLWNDWEAIYQRYAANSETVATHV